MHELAMTQRILEIVLEHAGGASKVTDVFLTVGELSGAADECVAFYWDILSCDTPAQGAKLHFRRIPFELECDDCGRVFSPHPDGFNCPDCGSPAVHVAGGEQLLVEAIDVDDPTDPVVSEQEYPKAEV